jgi:hypothetical protein
MVTDLTKINCVIRPVRRSDNSTVAQIIHQVMTEFDAVGSDCSISDLEVDNMYESYPAPGAAFFVVECSGTVLGCGGMGPLLEGGPGVCELQCISCLNCAAPAWGQNFWTPSSMQRAKPGIVSVIWRQ